MGEHLYTDSSPGKHLAKITGQGGPTFLNKTLVQVLWNRNGSTCTPLDASTASPDENSGSLLRTTSLLRNYHAHLQLFHMPSKAWSNFLCLLDPSWMSPLHFPFSELPHHSLCFWDCSASLNFSLDLIPRLRAKGTNPALLIVPCPTVSFTYPVLHEQSLNTKPELAGLTQT